MRICQRCNQEILNAYRNQKYCNDCKIKVFVEYQKGYWKSKPIEKRRELIERYKPYRAKWLLQNQDKVNKWREENKEKIRNYTNQYMKIRNQEFKEKHPEEYKLKRKKDFCRDYYKRSLEDVNKLKSAGCLLCGFSNINMIALHHKDKDKNNNQDNNLIPLCYNCHYGVHKNLLKLP